MHLVHSKNQILQDGNASMPQELMHYEIRHCLQLNAQSTLYEVWDTVLHRLVNIKKLTNLDEEINDVLKKTRTAASLNHPSLVKIHALETQGTTLYIVKEMVQGKPLRQWVQENQGRENVAIIHIKQVAMALQEAHAANLIHGDIKPENLVIDLDGKIRLINLGFASQYNPHKINNVAEIDPKDSISYLAPERFIEPQASAASDVFSLGIILYQMLTGQTPHSQSSGLSLVAAQAQTSSDHWPWPVSISMEVRNLILGMTDRDTKKRMTCQQVQEKCHKLVEDEAKTNSQNKTLMQALQAEVKSKNRRKKQIYGMALLLIFIALGIGIVPIKPNWKQLAQKFIPYSESVELDQGMQAITRYDKPEMLEAASQHFNRVLEHDASNAKALAGLSIVYSIRLRSNKRDNVWRGRALASAQQALKLNADLVITQIAYALALDPYRQFDLAMASVQKAKKIDPNNLLVWQTEIRTLLMARKFDVAIQTADTALKLFPHDWLILNLKATLLINQAQYEKAEKILRAVIETNPDVMLSYNYLAMVLDLQGRSEEALQVLQQGLLIRPDSELYSQLGQIRFNQADYSAAAYAMEKSVLMKPQSFDYWHLLANALMQIPGKEADSQVAFLKAKKLLEDILEKNPNDGWYIALMGLYDARFGSDDQAQVKIKKAIEIFPENPHVRFIAACTYELIGARKQALDEIHRAKKLGFSESLIKSEVILRALVKDARY